MLDDAQLAAIGERLAEVERLRVAALPERGAERPTPDLVAGLLDSHTAALALLDEVRRLRAAPAQPSARRALVPDAGAFCGDPGRGLLALQAAVTQLWAQCADALAGEEPE